MFLVLVVIYIIFISLGLPDSLLGVAWPVMHTEFGLHESAASIISLIVGVCTGGVSFVAGALLRKFGTAKVAIASIFVTALGLVGISLSPNVVVMVVFSVILGYGAGAIDTGLNSFVSLHYKASHMNWLHCFWGVGVTVSPLIMSLFLDSGNASWRNGYRVVAVLQLMIAAVAVLSLKKWNKIEKSSKNESDDEATETPKKTFFEIVRSKGVITGILSLGFYCSMEFIVGTWGATYAVNVFAFSPSEAAKWVSLYYGGIMLGRFVSGFLALKASDDFMIRGGMLICLLGMIILTLPIGSNAMFGLLLIGFGFGPVFPCILHSVPSRFGKEYAADITGFHMGGAYAVGFTSQMIFGFVATATTFVITPFVLLLFCALTLTLNEITLKKIKS